MDFGSQSSRQAGAKSPRRGFTLIELMITVAVISILAAVALPAYFDSIRKSRRADAVNMMSQVAQAQERWRANNAAYANDFGTALLNVRTSVPSGVVSLSEPYYTITVPTSTGTAYTVRALARSSQVSDTNCLAMEMRMLGGNLTYISSTSSVDATINTTITDANRCWSR